jgi:hypothetical protein
LSLGNIKELRIDAVFFNSSYNILGGNSIELNGPIPFTNGGVSD